MTKREELVARALRLREKIAEAQGELEGLEREAAKLQDEERRAAAPQRRNIARRVRARG